MHCQIKWVMPRVEAKRAGLLESKDRAGLALTWCSTEHDLPVEATHEVQARHDDGSVSAWFPCCTEHAAYSRGMARWQTRELGKEKSE